MKIARNMNLVAEVETENGQCWVHSTPISKEVYRQHFFILSKVFASIFSEGLGWSPGRGGLSPPGENRRRHEHLGR